MIELVPLLSDLWNRYHRAVSDLSGYYYVSTGVVVLISVVSLLNWPKRWERVRRSAQIAALVLIGTLTVANAWTVRWLDDSAFITFRYASNLAHGYGLVYNPGDRVEGYSSFLWTLLLVPSSLVSLSIPITALALNLLFALATLLLTSRIASIICPRRTRMVVSIAAVLLATNYVFVSFGSSGLDTVLGTALVLLAIERAVSGRLFQSGVAGTFAALAHSQHLLFYASLGIAVVIVNRNLRDLFRYFVSFLAIFVPYYIWRWIYYGTFFPNTFYVNSVSDPYYAQGRIYVAVCLVASGIVYWIPMSVAGVHRHRRDLFGKFMIIFIPVYLFYMIRVGGDYMLGRLFIPLFPLLAISVEASARRMTASHRYVGAVLGIALASLSSIPIRVINAKEVYHNISDERTLYPIRQLYPMRVATWQTDWAEKLRASLGSGFDGPLVETDSIGIIGFATGLPMVDYYGLTNPRTARRAIAQRGRVGHEKHTTGAILFDSGVVVSNTQVYPPYHVPLLEHVRGLPLTFVAYNENAVRRLFNIGPSSPVDTPSFISGYEAPQNDFTRLECDLWFFETYYFAHRAPEHRLAFFARNADFLSMSQRVIDFYSVPDRRIPDDWNRVFAIDFSGIDARDWMRVGTAFDALPSSGQERNQQAITGNIGPLVNSFTSESGDRSTGILQSPVFRLNGDVMTVRVGGGMDRDSLRVGLVVDGAEVASATGCWVEVLGRRVWDVSNYRGNEAVIVVIDNNTGGWGHILVDEIELFEKVK